MAEGGRELVEDVNAGGGGETCTIQEPGSFDFGFLLKISGTSLVNMELVVTDPENVELDMEEEEERFSNNLEKCIYSDTVQFYKIRWKLKLLRLLDLDQTDRMFRLSLHGCGSDGSVWSCSWGRVVLFWRPSSPPKFPFSLPLHQWPPQFVFNFFHKTHRLYSPGFRVIENLDFLWSDISGMGSMSTDNHDYQNKGIEVGVLIRGVTETHIWPSFSHPPPTPTDQTVEIRLSPTKKFYCNKTELEMFSEYFALRLSDRDRYEVSSDTGFICLKETGEENCLEDDFHLFLRCLLPPMLPLNLASHRSHSFFEVIRLADRFQCPTLKIQLSNWIVSMPFTNTVFGSTLMRIKFGDLYHLPMVVSQAIENMTACELRRVVEDPIAADLSIKSKALLFDRLREESMDSS